MEDKNIKEEASYIYDKNIKCPVCDKKFITSQVKTGKTRFMGSDDDLKPRYLNIDTIKYDVCMCPYCGYAAVMRDYENVSENQRKVLRAKIGNKYNAMMIDTGVYSYDTAIRRYKMALLTATVKPSKLSEASYLCLKLSLLYKGKIEAIQSGQEQGTEADIEKCQNNINKYENIAYNGFKEALLSEFPPICGMNEVTVNLLMAVLGNECKDYTYAKKFAFMVVSSRSTTQKTKEKARNIIEDIKRKQKEEGISDEPLEDDDSVENNQ